MYSLTWLLLVRVDHNSCGYKLKNECCGGERMEELVESKPGSREIWFFESVHNAAERIAEASESDEDEYCDATMLPEFR